MSPERDGVAVVGAGGRKVVPLEPEAVVPVLESSGQQVNRPVHGADDDLLATERIPQHHTDRPAPRGHRQITQVERTRGQIFSTGEKAVDVDVRGGRRRKQAGQGQARRPEQVRVEGKFTRDARSAENESAAEGAEAHRPISQRRSGERGAVVVKRARQSPDPAPVRVPEGATCQESSGDRDAGLEADALALEVDQLQGVVQERARVLAVDHALRPWDAEVHLRPRQEARVDVQVQGDCPLIDAEGHRRRQSAQGHVGSAADDLHDSLESSEPRTLEVVDLDQDVVAPQQNEQLPVVLSVHDERERDARLLAGAGGTRKNQEQESRSYESGAEEPGGSSDADPGSMAHPEQLAGSRVNRSL